MNQKERAVLREFAAKHRNEIMEMMRKLINKEETPTLYRLTMLYLEFSKLYKELGG